MKRALIILLLCACGGGREAVLPDGGSPSASATATVVLAQTVSPASGSTSGGISALVTGSGFVEGFAAHGGSQVSGQTLVTFGGVAAADLNVIDDNRIELTVPAGAAGPSDVVVTNPNGTGTCTGCYRYVEPIRVDAIAPATGQAGVPVTLHGQGFTPESMFTIGGRELISPQIVDAKTATGFAPQGIAGGADVLAVTFDGIGELRRGFVYTDGLRLDGATPGVVPTAGGAKVMLTGAGFASDAVVQAGGSATTTVWIDAQHLQFVSPAHAAGAVDLAVGGASLAHGLTFADAGGAAALYAVQPPHGPLAGGTTLHLYGAGLTGAQIAIGGHAAATQAVSDSEIDAVVPAGAASGAVDVQAGALLLAGGFSYDPILAVTTISPAQSAAAGGVQVTVSGAGFDASAQLFIGALPATPLLVSSTTLSALAPAGSPGLADVTVVQHGQTVTLPQAFTYTGPAQLLQITPVTGARSGGERVTLYGRGLTTSASIGGAALAQGQLVAPTQLVALTPPGTVGVQDVVANGSMLSQSFTYFDPSSNFGGATGGPLLGTLNVSVLEESAFKSGGVAGATVLVLFEDGAQVQGTTDANGQISFSDDRLDLPVQVTAVKDSYAAFTAVDVQSSNLTLGIAGPAGTPPPPPTKPPAPAPTPTQTATLSGHVFGFKRAPGTVLSRTQTAVARVSIAPGGINALPPFAGAVSFVTVASDGGAFSFSNLFSLGPTTLYAVFGIVDSADKSFTPLLLGILRGVQPSLTKPVTNADITLDTHLDQTVTVTVLNPPTLTGGHDAFVDLDLGQSGAIPLARVTQNSDPFHLTFTHLPRAAGQGFVFVDEYGSFVNGTVTIPVTTYLRRVFADLSDGITLGPLLPFPVLQQQGPDRISWTLGASAQRPDLQQLSVADGTTGWSVVLPGDARQIALPGPVRSRLQKGTHGFSLTAAVEPGLDFAHWNFTDLGSGSWTAFAFSSGSFTIP